MAAGPVSRILSATRMLRDDHSSGPRITAGLKRPTRRFGAPSRHAWRFFQGPSNGLRLLCPRARFEQNGSHRPLTRALPFLPYLVLLRVGFAMPCALLPRRCALTAPFHPYRNSRTSPARQACACFAFASGSKRIGLRRSLICGGIFSVALSVKLA